MTMTLEEFKDKVPGSLLLPFHEIRAISWDEASKTGRVEAVRRNAVDDWFYACHFQGDPVMPGCWGIDAIWQALKVFAGWKGLKGCDKIVGMESVSFFGQIRPHDKEIVYTVEGITIEEDGGEYLVTGKASVAVDGVQVYTIGAAQVGTAYWEADADAKPPALKIGGDEPMTRRLDCAEFAARSSLSHAEVLALAQGNLVREFPGEIGLLPNSFMLEVGRLHELSFDPAVGEGRIVATRRNSALDWFYPMNRGEKPTALTVDAVWQLLGLFLFWRQNPGTGRALGFERVEAFDAIRPQDRELLYEVKILRMTKSEASGDAFVRADAKVFADGRLVLACSNANVGCHKNIRYSDYPQLTDMGLGGKLKTRTPGG